MSDDETRVKRTREDLIQLEYDLYSEMLDERRIAREAKFDYWAQRWLEAATSERTGVHKTYTSPLSDAIAIVLGAQVRRHADQVRGANVGDSPNWGRTTTGDRFTESADWMTAFFPAHSLTEVACIVQTWEQHAERHVKITVRQDAEEIAHTYMRDLEAEARGPANPWRGKLLEAKIGVRGFMFEPRAVEDMDPGPLWFPDATWDSFSSNVVRALPQLERLEKAGLGSNRGVLLIGPPGTGKTALCRWGARQLAGTATVVLTSAQVGHWQVSQLYEELGHVSPAVVFLEDLDLLVGDREEGSERGALIEFLTVLEGLMTRHHQVISVASSNDPASIDAAAMRAGRFDVVIELQPPTLDGRRAILGTYLERMGGDIDADVIAELTEGFTGADLREVLRRSVLAAGDEALTTELVRRSIETHSFIKQAAGPHDSRGREGPYL